MALMSIPKIGGREARELLDVCPPWDRVKIAQTVDLDHGPDRAVLASSAHDLAETVAWLYGREPEHGHAGIHTVMIRGGKDADLVYAVKGGTIIFELDGGHRTIEEAEEFARAILAVVEESRDE